VYLDRLSRDVSAVDPAGNRIDKTPISADSLRLRGGRLAELLAYWGDLRSSGARVSDIDTVRFSQIGLLGMLHLVNVANPDRERFYFEIRGTLAPSVPGTCGAGAPVLDHPVRIVAESAITDYETVRATGAPHYARIRSRLLGRDYSYHRLIVPLSTDGRQIDRLLVGIDPA
jgi:hypothetical protein